MRRIPSWLSGAMIVGTIVTLSWLERRRGLRPRVEPDVPHVARNLSVAGIGAATLVLAERPLVDRLARIVERRRWGLLKRMAPPRGVEVAAAVVLMDYTLYVWHVLTHRVPILWRAHAVHHIDLDLDTTTALRFHFAELLASVPWRCAQIAGIGVSPLSLSIWQTLLVVSILFHHSNVELPFRVERALGRLIVTPRMHGIHHSRAAAEVNSNWSSGLTIWDWLHGTLKLNVPQQAIPIGVPGFTRAEQVRLGPMLAFPFAGPQPPLGDGARHDVPTVPTTTLLP